MLHKTPAFCGRRYIFVGVHVCVPALQHMLFVQHPRRKHAQSQRQRQHNGKPGGGVGKRHTVGLDVHAVQTADNGGHGHQQGDAGQVFHGVVQAVVQNRAEQLSCALDIVAVDAGHLNGLANFDDNVVQQFAVVGVLLQPLAQPLVLPGYRGEWFPVPLKRASSAASFPLVKFQLEVGILSIVLQNHSGIVGLAGFLRI